MDIRVLGPLEVRADDGAALELGSPLQRTLLALLLLDPGVVRSTDWLVEHLWPDGGAPGAPVASVQTYVARARRTLRSREGRPVVERSGSGYRATVDGTEVDAVRFAAAASAARHDLRAGRPADALAHAQAALSLWRGPAPWPELEDREVALAARDRLAELRLGCEEDRLEALLALGRPEDAVADLEALTAAQPLRERGWLLLVRALALAGRVPDALERYQRVREHLSDELGLEPGPALRELHLAVLRGDLHRPPLAPPRPGDPTGTGSSPTDLAGTGTGEAASGAPRPSGSAVLCGRDSQLRVLTDVLRDLTTAGPRFVVLEGEPGIGKTRLAQGATDTARGHGLRVAWGRCHEDASVPALWPWRQVVSTLGADRALTADDLAAVFEQVRDVLVRASAVAPVLVVLDDLHWADPASLRLLSFLTREIDRAPVAFLVTTRPGNHSEQHVPTRADLARTDGFRHLELGPLDADATAALVTSVVGAAPHEEVRRVTERSGGNPFFALELARLLDGTGDPGALPGGVRDVIRRRLAQLGAASRDLMAVAAVLGDDFSFDLLLRAQGADEPRAVEALDEALACALLRADAGSLAFSHALVRETLLADLTDVERRRLHARVARAEPVDVFERAHHLLEGRPFTPAATTEAACRQAAARAERDRTYDSAAQWWERALDQAAATPSTAPPRQRLLLSLATDLVRSGRAIVGQDRLRECLEVALGEGDTATAVDACTVLAGSQGSWYWVEYGTYPTALLALLRRTLAALPPEDEAARVRVLLTTAAGEQYGDTAAAKVLARDAVATARCLGDPAVLAEALAGWLYCTWSSGDEEAVAAAATELLALAEALPDALHLTLLARLRRSQVLLVLGDTAGSDADVDAAWQLATELRLPLYQAEVIQLQGGRAVLAGEFELSEELYEQARVLHERVQMHAAQLTDAASLLLLRREQGRAAELLPLVDGMAVAAHNGVDVIVVAALLQSGEADRAREMCRRYATLAPAPRWWNWQAWTCFQADLASSLGDLDAAERLVEDLRPYVGHVALYGAVGALGPVTRFLGRAEAALGRWDDAEEHLRACLRQSRALGFRPSEADASVTLAEVLLATGRADDAAALLRDAVQLATDVGMSHVQVRARELLSHISTANP
ncbi:MAG: ATP-binding protein [Ornithinibacter sp.]